MRVVVSILTLMTMFVAGCLLLAYILLTFDKGRPAYPSARVAAVGHPATMIQQEGRNHV